MTAASWADSYHPAMGDDAALTELAGVAELQTESVQAWALDYDEYESASRRFTPRRVTAAALGVSLVLMGVAGVIALLGVRGVWQVVPTPTAPTAAPTMTPTATTPAAPTTVVAQPGPWFTPTKPVTVTVQAPPQTVQAEPEPPQMTIYDQDFMQELQQRGLTVTDPAIVIRNARGVCAKLRQGEDLPQISEELSAATGLDVSTAHVFASVALQVYPACTRP